MISLPPGFDYPALIADFFSAAVPFAGVAALFIAYAMVKKCLNGGR